MLKIYRRSSQIGDLGLMPSVQQHKLSPVSEVKASDVVWTACVNYNCLYCDPKPLSKNPPTFVFGFSAPVIILRNEFS